MAPTNDSDAAEVLLEEIRAQGEKVRALKAQKADVAQELDQLKALKTQYKELTGEDPPASSGKVKPKKLAADKQSNFQLKTPKVRRTKKKTRKKKKKKKKKKRKPRRKCRESKR